LVPPHHVARVERLGEYELMRRIAVGGMAEVFEAKRSGPHGFSKRFALKRILPHFAGDARFVQMFCDEARVHATLSHPNLVEVVDFGEERAGLYLVMEFVDGLSCADLYSGVVARKRTVELGAALYIVREVLAGLAHAHEHCDDAGRPLNLVHRDVTPNNILLSQTGRVLLADFGIVHTAFGVPTRPGELKGKVGFVPPEQALGRGVDARADLFSLAVVLSELLLGAPLFAGDNEREILTNLHAGNMGAFRSASQIPADLRAVLARALSLDPELRQPSARALSLELEGVARRHGVLIDSYQFTQWLADLGLLALKSGTRESLASWQEVGKSASVPPVSRAPGLRLVHSEAPTTPRLAAQDSGLPAYRLRRAGGAVVGPVSLATVLEWIASARVPADSEVSRSGGPFMPISAVSELGRFVSRALYRFQDPVALFASERHAIEPSTLPWHLFRYLATRKTGLVCACRGSEQRRVYFVNGVPGASASSDPSELLGASFVRAGRLTQDALDRALERGYREGKPLGQALLDSGLIGPGELLSALAEQRTRRLSSLLALRQGELYFVDGAESGEQALAPPAAPTAFLVGALRSAYTEGELRVLLAGVAQKPLTARPILHLQRSLLGLTPAEGQAFDRAACGVPVGVILSQARALGVEIERAALFGLFAGICSGAFGT
jgi:serine/threonine-protein kinase